MFGSLTNKLHHCTTMNSLDRLCRALYVNIIKTFNITQLAMLFIWPINLFDVKRENNGESISGSLEQHPNDSHKMTNKLCKEKKLLVYSTCPRDCLFSFFDLRNSLGNVNETIAHSPAWHLIWCLRSERLKSITNGE